MRAAQPAFSIRTLIFAGRLVEVRAARSGWMPSFSVRSLAKRDGRPNKSCQSAMPGGNCNEGHGAQTLSLLRAIQHLAFADRVAHVGEGLRLARRIGRE